MFARWGKFQVVKIHNLILLTSLDVCKVGKIHAGVKNLTPATVMVLRNKTHAESGASNEAPEAETRSYAIRPMQNQV